MPNTFAYAMLLLWPLVALWLFKRLPRSEALIWTLVAGYLLLPSGTVINLPALPALSKSNSPAFGALVMCMAGVGVVMTRQRGQSARKTQSKAAMSAHSASERPGWLPNSVLAKLLIVLVVLGPFVTSMLNTDQVNFSYGGFIKGLNPYDAFSSMMNHGVLLLPLLLARKYLANLQDQRLILRILMLAGLAYSIPMLIEVRLSPQLHTWVYGFFQHSFAQAHRFGGFRPFVFLDHGLRVALFAAMVLLAAAALWRTTPRADRTRPLLAALWLGVMLVLCRSVGALALAAAIVPMILIMGRRTQMLMAAAIAVFVMLYPAIRGGGMITAPGTISVVEKWMPSKAGSLRLRLVNEDQLLNRAAERPVFGWGPWGRGRVYDEYTGKDISITDGVWTIIIGEFGWVGYVGTFGLLTLPILSLFRQRGDPGLTMETSALSLILSLNLLDLLPNSGLTLITWLLAGALLGRAEQIVAERDARLSQRRAVRGAENVAETNPAVAEPRPLRGGARSATAPGRSGGGPTKARVAPQHASGYPSPDDAPPRRRPPSGRTRR